MRIAVIADTFPPLRSSGAVQLRDLTVEFVRQGHEVAMLVASSGLNVPWLIEGFCGVQVVRLRTPRTKDIGYIQRMFGEFLMPFAMLYNLNKSPLYKQKWDGIIWYSPSIFFGPLVSSLKKTSNCKSYLIIRDIFPEWAVDMGIMGKGLPYRFFKAVANFQYSVADVIGIQTQGNRAYFNDVSLSNNCRVEVLQNWLAEMSVIPCSIDINNTCLVGRKIFVYAGNMGIAQGMGILLDLAEAFIDRLDVGFLFVGRGSDARFLRDTATQRALSNVIFYDEIDPDEIPGLYKQCHVGLVALDPRHKTHNIPGKFLSYMQSGLPVLAVVNEGNDLVNLINAERVGEVCTDVSISALIFSANLLINNLTKDLNYSDRCRDLSVKLFSSSAAVHQLVDSLTS